MKTTFNKFFTTILLGSAIGFVSCNKDVANPTPIAVPAPSGSTLAATINADANLSLLKFAANRAGVNVTSILGDATGVYTLFAPTDAAFAISGFADTNAIKTLPAAQWEAILRYHIVGGQKLRSSMIPETFPNLQLPTQFVLAPPSAALPPGLRMSVFPSKRGTSLWANAIPLTQTDIEVSNGILHRTAALLSPPTTTIKGLLASNPTKYSILLAAIARADSGLVAPAAGLNRLDSAINFAAANLTVFAPNNDAFRALFPAGTPDAAIIATLNNPAAFTAQTVRALIAYHLLGVRAFSVNFSATSTPVNTQLAIPNTPPTVVPVIVANAGASFTVRSIVPNSPAATVLQRDVHAINGVVHEINMVLRPQ